MSQFNVNILPFIHSFTQPSMLTIHPFSPLSILYPSFSSTIQLSTTHSITPFPTHPFHKSIHLQHPHTYSSSPSFNILSSTFLLLFLSDFNERFCHNADRQRSPVMRLIPVTTPSAPQWLIYCLGSPNFSRPVIAVRELVCHPMSGTMLISAVQPDCVG